MEGMVRWGAGAAQRPLNSGLRRSRNARVPSRISSVVNTRPNCAASYSIASSRAQSAPTLTQSCIPRISLGSVRSSVHSSLLHSLILFSFSFFCFFFFFLFFFLLFFFFFFFFF